MGKVTRAIREILVQERLEKLITEANLITGKTNVYSPTRIIYPDARVVVSHVEDPFAVFDKYTEVFGKALPLWQMIASARYFGHIGYHMYFAHDRFKVKYVNKLGEPVVDNLHYQPAIPYEIHAWYEHNNAEISQWYLLPDFLTYTHTFGFVPMALQVTVKCPLKTLELNIIVRKKTIHEPAKIVSDPPQHERLNADWWKIWGQNQLYKRDGLHQFEYEGLVDEHS